MSPEKIDKLLDEGLDLIDQIQRILIEARKEHEKSMKNKEVP